MNKELATPVGSWMYVKITKRMYGLPQEAGSLALVYNLLETRLNKAGYFKRRIASDLWNTSPATCNLYWY